MDVLRELQCWFLEQCDGRWEHRFGVKIETLDNPGWTVAISLDHTPLEQANFPEYSDVEPDVTWAKCWKEGTEFRGVGGPNELERILRIFLEWARAAARGNTG